MTRALSVYLPDWPIWLARRNHRRRPLARRDAESVPPEAQAWILWTSRRGVQLVVAACEPSRAAGVRPGMTLAQARSLCAGLAVHDHEASPDQDAAALRRLARWMLRYAPIVAPDDPDGLILDIAGCEHLFGGERPHARQIADALRRWGLRPKLAVAPTLAAAWAIARFSDAPITCIPAAALREALAPLPVSALRLNPKTIDTLADLAVERIEQVLALPRDDLAARFGPDLLLRLDQALGAAPESIHPILPAPRFAVSHAFDGPLRRLEIIEATARELLARLLAQFAAADQGILELIVELRRIDLAPHCCALRLTCPNRDHAHLWKLLAPRLERAHLGYGITDIILLATRTAPLKQRQTAFLRDADPDASSRPAALGELVDQLIDRLGPAAITQVRPAESYVPEAAFPHARITLDALAPAALHPRAANPAHRPSRLLDTPEPIRVISLVPDGPPIWLHWQNRQSKILAAQGPERIAAPWWTHGFAASRDYYEIEDEFARRLWIFRDIDSGRWFLHGRWT